MNARFNRTFLKKTKNRKQDFFSKCQARVCLTLGITSAMIIINLYCCKQKITLCKPTKNKTSPFNPLEFFPQCFLQIHMLVLQESTVKIWFAGWVGSSPALCQAMHMGFCCVCSFFFNQVKKGKSGRQE